VDACLLKALFVLLATHPLGFNGALHLVVAGLPLLQVGYRPVVSSILRERGLLLLGEGQRLAVSLSRSHLVTVRPWNIHQVGL